jgi:hypothetical protein
VNATTGWLAPARVGVDADGEDALCAPGSDDAAASSNPAAVSAMRMARGARDEGER